MFGQVGEDARSFGNGSALRLSRLNHEWWLVSVGVSPRAILVYSGSKESLSAPQTGQTQSSGTFSQAVPGATSFSGSPCSGS